MGARGEKTLIQHLSDPASMVTLVKEGLPEVCVPDEELREVYLWCLDQFFRSGMTKAPSVAVILEQWGDLLSDREIEMETEPEDSIEWVIDDLKGSHIWRVSQEFNKRFAKEIADAPATERAALVDAFATELVGLSFDMANQEMMVDVRQGVETRHKEYAARSLDQSRVYGMSFGIPQIDTYTRGIHPGELAVVAAGPKVGKSWFLDLVALREWREGKVVTLFTMENSIEDTQDRIACLAAGIGYRDFQHGTCSPEEMEKFEEWKANLKAASNPFFVIQPAPGQRNIQTLVREAQLRESDSLLLDQLSYLEARDERQPRHLQIREITHMLRGMISSGRKRMPCLLAHQINREGLKAAAKLDHLDMVHLAEGSETERTADWVFGLFRARADMVVQQARFQTLAARREVPEHFKLTWNVGAGMVSYKGTWVIE